MIDKLARLNELLLARTVSVFERRELGHWINLPRQWWSHEFGYRDYLEVQEAAESLGMLEIQRRETGVKRYLHHSGRAKGYCTGYRLSSEYRDGSHLIWELNRKPRTKPEYSDLSPSAAHIASKLPMWTVAPQKAQDAWDAISATMICRGSHRAVQCEYGRLHTLLTSSTTELRSSLRMVEGQNKATSIGTVLELDVANCQPLLLCALLPDPAEHDDYGRWNELAHDGSLYEVLLNWVRKNIGGYLVKKAGRPFKVNPSEWTRKILKRHLMYVLFGKHPGVESDPAWKAIAYLFPKVAEKIIELKADRYQELARQLQRKESNVVIEGIGGELMRCHPEIPIVTVHDCLILPYEYRDLGIELLLKHFGDIGLKPTISEQVYRVAA